LASAGQNRKKLSPLPLFRPKLVPETRKLGIRVLPGDDHGIPYNLSGSNASDLELFVKLSGFYPAAVSLQ